MHKKTFAVRILVFFIGFALIFSLLNSIFLIKGEADKSYKYNPFEYYNNASFYREDSDSLDVIFIGTSQSLLSINPLELWNKFGIPSHVLSAGSLSAKNAYYYLKEALKFQHPQVIFLDASVIKYTSSSETSYSKINWMHPSVNKYNALSDCCDFELLTFDEKFIRLSDFLLAHDTWSSLEKHNFHDYRDRYNFYHGYFYVANSTVPPLDYDSNYNCHPSNLLNWTMPEEVTHYLSLIRKLCSDNNCDLIFFKSPSYNWYAEYSDALEQYCNSNSLTFCDYSSNLLELGLNQNTCFYDFYAPTSNAHLNNLGANAITQKIGQYLSDNYVLDDKRFFPEYSQWNDDYQLYLQEKMPLDLYACNNIDSYLNILKSTNYLYIITVMDDATLNLQADTLQLLQALGLQATFSNYLGSSYIAIIDAGNILYEAMSPSELISCNIQTGINHIYAESAGWDYGNTTKISINGRDYAQGKRGLNIVVYDNQNSEVIDSVVFDTHLNGESNRSQRLSLKNE